MAAVKQDLTVAIKLNDQFTAPLRDIQKETANTFDENRQGSFLSGIKASTVALAGLATAGIAAVGAGLTSAFNQAREFEQSMADVSAITGATGQTLQGLSDLARDMGATTAFSAKEAAEGIQFLGMAGFNTNDIMDALPSTLNLAAAAGMELGAAADIASNIMSGMGMTADELGGVVDKLAQTSRNANTDVGMLGEAFKMVGPTASAAGVDFDDVTTSLGLLANAGLQGSIGGTSLNSALRAMISPSKEAAKQAEALGLRFQDSNGQMLPMVDILEQLDEKSVTTQQAFEIFGTEGARAINALRAQGVDAFTILDEKIKESGGVAQDMAEVRLGSFDGAVKQLTSALSEMAISVGEQIVPMATALINDFLLPAVNNTNEFIKSVGGFGQMFSDALAVIVGFKNTAINVLNELYNNADFAKNFLGNLGGIFNAAFNLVSNFAVGTSGQGGMYGIIIELAKIVWEPLRQAFLAFWGAIKKPYLEGVNFISETFVKGINVIIDSFNELGDYIGLTIDRIDFNPITVEASKTFSERWAEGSANVRQSLDNIKGFASEMGDALEADTDRVTGAIAATAESASHLVDEGMRDVVQKYSEITTSVATNAEKEGEQIGQNLATGTEEGFDPKLKIDENDVDTSGLEKALEKADITGSLGSSVGKGLGDIIRGGDVNTAVLDTAKNFTQSIAGSMTDMFKSGGTFMQIAGPMLVELFGPVLDFLFADRYKAERQAYEGVAEQIASAVEMGGIGKFSFTTAEGRALRGQQQQYGRAGVSSRSKIRADLMNKLQEQFGKDRQGTYYLSTSDARELSLALLEDRGQGIYGEAGVKFTEMITDVIVRSTADRMVEQRKREQFSASIEEEAMALAGITPAANGYNGMVGGPTLFLAGEEGPEHVNITPASRMRGGFAGSGGNNYHFNFSVSAIDEKSVKSFIETDAKDFIVNMLQRESTRGRSVMYNTGLVADPSV